MSDCSNVKKVFVPTKGTSQEASQEAPVEHIKGIKITDTAADKIKLFLTNSQKDTTTHGLWIGVVKDGCSGMSYTMDLKEIAPSLENGDKIFTHNGATAMVEKINYMFVTGSILDYVEALTGSGFTLVNPNVKKTCSCGSSFSVK